MNALKQNNQAVNINIKYLLNYTRRFFIFAMVGAFTVFSITGCSNSILDNSKAISSFNFTSPLVAGIINETNNTIMVTVPANTTTNALIPIIVHSGISISPESDTPQDFSAPITYTVTAEDGSKQDYVVTVIVAATISSLKSITAFSFSTSTSTIITVTAEDGTTQEYSITVLIVAAPILDNIKIASFNMQILGNTKIGRTNTFTILASIATRFDIMAIQEVGSNNSSSSDATCTTIMNTYLAKVNEIAGSSVYSYVRGNQYAIVYRNDKFTLNNSSLYAGSQTFTYTPLLANFKMKQGNFDFSLLTIHTSPSLAITEIPSLKTAITETVTLYSESDVICLGDFNADGTYYSEGSGTGLAGFEGYITGIPNTADTTVATSSNTYDRMQMTTTVSSDYTAMAGVFIFSDYYDVTTCEGATTTAGTESALSDHYPVWCEYATNADND